MYSSDLRIELSKITPNLSMKGAGGFPNPRGQPLGLPMRGTFEFELTGSSPEEILEKAKKIATLLEEVQS